MTLFEVKPARIGYFTIRGSGERNPLGYRCAGVNLTVAVAVDLLGRHEAILPTAPRGLQQLPLHPLLHPCDLAVDALQAKAESAAVG